MPAPEPFFPQALFSGEHANRQDAPKVFISPHRYIQGKGVMAQLGSYLSVVPSKRPAVLISSGGKSRFGAVLGNSFQKHRISASFEIFEGECSYEEVERMADVLSSYPKPVDAIIGVGGGKCIDAAKCVAFRMEVPVIICPTIASTDAPCSAVSVMYTQEGEGIGPQFFPSSPAIVLVDTAIIAESPKRHLVAGMGDALATWYEAKMCNENPAARSMVGGRMTLAALAIAELCAKTIYEYGCKAADAIEQKIINEPLEKVIEANTLLSGIGFESGGLSIAHAVASGLTVIPVLHQRYLHGELVGIGTLIHLIMDGNKGEALKAATFMAKVGLPVVVEQLSLDMGKDAQALKKAMSAAIGSTLTNSAPFPVTAEGLFSALEESQQLCAEIVRANSR